MTFAGFAMPRLLDKPLSKPAERGPVQTTTVRRSEAADLGECTAAGVHAIFTPTRLYICVAMEPKPDALAAQREADKREAAGLFEVDALWSAAAVNARWGKKAVLCSGDGQVLESAASGSRGMTDVGAKEAFFEFHMPERCPEELYLGCGSARLRVR